MPVSVGDELPDATVHVLRDGRPVAVQIKHVLGAGKVVLFAVPGAFTPSCSATHLPGYVHRADELKAGGVDTIACVAVNDAWVMDAWAAAQGAGDSILMLADGNGQFADAMGLGFDGSGIGLGHRSSRYAAIVEDGVITSLEVEPGPGVSVSSCESMLEKVR